MQRKALTITLVLTLVLSSATAWSGCVTRNLKGTWHYFFLTTDTDGKTNRWANGLIKVRASGAIVSGTTLILNSDHKVSVTGGKLSISNNCLIKGNIKLQDDHEHTATIKKAVMDKSNKTFMSGVSVDSDGDYGLFTAIKK